MRTNALKRISLALIILTAVVMIGYIFYTTPIIMFDRHHLVELGDTYNPLDFVNMKFTFDSEEIKVNGDIDTSKEGIYKATIVAREQKIPVTVEVIDTKAPELVLKDLKTDTKRKLYPKDFVESVLDAQEVKIDFDKKSKNLITKEGFSDVTIIATDKSGNSSKSTATLERIKDTKKPEISGLKESYDVVQGQKLIIEGISAKDDLDLCPTWKFNDSKVDYNTIGTYSVTFSAKDLTGNETKETRPVNIIENEEWSKNIVYLTFDDGPSQHTKEILDILDKYDAKATFFVTGNNTSCNKYIKEAYDKGHTIGLHTYTHNYDSVYASEDAYFKDLKKVSDMVKEITGKESKIIRFPGGSSNTVSANTCAGIMTKLTKKVREKGYQYFDWNVSSGDASGWNVPVKHIEKVAKVNADGNLVILMHDVQGKETTVKALENIIKYYKNRGFEFRALTLDSFPAHHGVNN